MDRLFDNLFAFGTTGDNPPAALGLSASILSFQPSRSHLIWLGLKRQGRFFERFRGIYSALWPRLRRTRPRLRFYARDYATYGQARRRHLTIRRGREPDNNEALTSLQRQP